MSDPVPPEYDGAPIPADLIAVKADAIEAQRRAGELVASWPPTREVAAGRAEITDQQRAEVEQTRDQERVAAETILAHPWWQRMDKAKRLRGREALRAAAEAALAVRQTADRR